MRAVIAGELSVYAVAACNDKRDEHGEELSTVEAVRDQEARVAEDHLPADVD